MADNQNLQLGNYTLATEVYQKTDVNQISNIIVDDYTTQIETVSNDICNLISANNEVLSADYAGKAAAARSAAEATAHNELTAESDALCAEIDIVKGMIPEPVTFDNKTIVDGVDGKEVAIDNDTIVYDSEISAIKIVVDDRITNISDNPVQNKTITEKILQLETAIQLLMDNVPTTRIRTAADLANISANLTADYFLMNDIDMTGTGYWVGPKNFAGSINGNGHTIKNLKLASIKYNGLIGTTAANSNVKIRDLNMENVTMDLQDNYAGVMYTVVSQLSTIGGVEKAVLRDETVVDIVPNTVYICKDDSGGDNYYFDAEGHKDGYEPGGAAFIGRSGSNANVTISNCKASGTLGEFREGFAFDNSGYEDTLTEQSPFEHLIYAPLGHQAAGFIARYDGSIAAGTACTLTINNCENNINVFTEFNKAGGFVAMEYGNGTKTPHQITDCVNNGTIIGGKASAYSKNGMKFGGVGGFIGHSDGNNVETVEPRPVCKYCKNNGKIYSFSSLSAVPGPDNSPYYYGTPYNYYGYAWFGTLISCDPSVNKISAEMDSWLQQWKDEWQWQLSGWPYNTLPVNS